MKFTKEDAIKNLVARMTAKGEKLNLSQRSINEQVEALLSLLANDETEIEDFVSKILPIVQTADANIRNDVSLGIKEYQEKNPKTTNPTNPTPPTQTPPTDANEVILKRLEELERKNKEAELLVKTQGIKAQLSGKMRELGIKNDKWIETMVANTTIGEEFDVDSNASRYLEIYNSMQAVVDPNVTPAGTGGGKPDYVGDTINAAAAIAKQHKL